MGNCKAKCFCCFKNKSALRHGLIHESYGANDDYKHRIDSSLSQDVFIPTVNVLKVHNGIIELNINHPQPYKKTAHDQFTYELCYRFKNICNQDTKWKSKSFSSQHIFSTGTIHIRTNLYFYDYQMELKFRSKHHTQKDFNPYSAAFTVNICASLTPISFHVGEYVEFWEENAVRCKPAFVQQILDNSLQIETRDGVIKVCSNRCTKSIDLKHVIDLTDTICIDQNILLRYLQNDHEKISVFLTIKNAASAFESQFIKNNIDTHFVSRFIAINVMQFLFDPYYKEPKVGCLVQDCRGWLKAPLPHMHCLYMTLQYCITIGKSVKEVDLEKNRFYCYVCNIEIHKFDSIAGCIHESETCNSHPVCLFCVNNKIESFVQLKALLDDLLQNALNDDCIRTLVELVVGTVIAFEKR